MGGFESHGFPFVLAAWLKTIKPKLFLSLTCEANHCHLYNSLAKNLDLYQQGLLIPLLNVIHTPMLYGVVYAVEIATRGKGGKRSYYYYYLDLFQYRKSETVKTINGHTHTHRLFHFPLLSFLLTPQTQSGGGSKIRAIQIKPISKHPFSFSHHTWHSHQIP